MSFHALPTTGQLSSVPSTATRVSFWGGPAVGRAVRLGTQMIPTWSQDYSALFSGISVCWECVLHGKEVLSVISLGRRSGRLQEIQVAHRGPPDVSLK